MNKQLASRVAQSSFSRGLVALCVGMAALSANAAIDTTAATGGIADASTAVLAVIAALTTMAVSIWAVRKVMKLFGGK